MAFAEDLDFEISFFQEILKDNPNFIDALTALGNAYTKKGCYKEGLEIDKKLIQLKPDEPIVYYNLACSYSLLRMSQPCLAALKKAIELGYRDFDFMEADSDLEFIRQDARYRELISLLRQ